MEVRRLGGEEKKTSETKRELYGTDSSTSEIAQPCVDGGFCVRHPAPRSQYSPVVSGGWVYPRVFGAMSGICFKIGGCANDLADLVSRFGQAVVLAK